jgi:hypothetical protein
VEAGAPSAWVLEAKAPGALRRAVRATKALEPERTVALGERTVCVQLGADAPPPPRRLERRLGHPVEARLDCDVARYAMGRGYYVLLVGRTDEDDGLDAVLDAEGLAYRETVRASTLGEPTRVCVPVPAVADLEALSVAIRSAGLPMVAIYEVGACSR